MDEKEANFNKLYKLVGELSEVSVRIHDRNIRDKEPAPGMPCVPKSIGLCGKNEPDESACILNLDVKNRIGTFQALWKAGTDGSFRVTYWRNDNDGSNYTYRKVDKPEANKLYFVTDRDDMASSDRTEAYIVFLKERRYVSWKGMGCTVTNYIFGPKHYYEIVPVEKP